MPETKLNLKDLGTIHLMALDTSSLFLPFGRPIAEYLRGATGNQNGSRALLKQGPVEFSPDVRWTESIASLLRTTGFGELEREGLDIPVKSEPTPADPGVADFLKLSGPSVASHDASREIGAAKISPAIAREDLPITLPRISALPLRLRMSFGPAPAAKSKPAPVVAPLKAVPVPPAAKSAPVVAPPPKPAQAAPPKPAAPVSTQKAAPTPVQNKPVIVIPPAPKPGVTPVAPQRVTVLQPAAAAPKIAAPQAPAARAPEPSPSQPKLGHAPARVPVAPDSPVAEPPKPSPAIPPQVAKAPQPMAPPKPAAEPVAVRTTTREAVAKEIPKPAEPVSRPRATGSLSITAPAETSTLNRYEPNLTMGASDSKSFLDKVPTVAKIGIAIGLLIIALYFVFGKSEKEPDRPIAVGEQGWSTEWASDAVGSRRGRQITLYRPSVGMSDYQFQFVGQIESKALGWVFREFDTKNYYGMKLESLHPGSMALTHFAVVEGRESSYSQKALSIDARPGASYRVTLDVNGPRFTVSLQGEPVDFWTDNRLKTGAVGFMNERDERGASSSVKFSFPRAGQ